MDSKHKLFEDTWHKDFDKLYPNLMVNGTEYSKYIKNFISELLNKYEKFILDNPN